MKTIRFALPTVLTFGVMLFLMPLCSFEGQPGPHHKLIAFHSMMESLVGLGLISMVLWARILIRRLNSLQEDKKSYIDRRLAEMISRNPTVANAGWKRLTVP